MTDFEQKTLENIQRFGCAVMHVPEEGDLPPFSFSVGVTKTAGFPELIVIGLQQALAQSLINDYYHRLQAGEVFRAGGYYAGFLEGFDVHLERVLEAHYEDYLGYNLGFYDGPHFEALQLIYPNTKGIWPWQPEADAWFQARQPLLTKT